MNTKDPYNEFADVLPLTVADAAQGLRNAVDAQALAQGQLVHAKQALALATSRRDTAKHAVERAEHCLKISALAHTGGAA
jgi:hypothetical protein